ICDAADRSASLVEIADQLDDSPSDVVHRRLVPAFNVVMLWVIGRHGTARGISRRCTECSRSAHWNKRQSKTLQRLAKRTRVHDLLKTSNTLKFKALNKSNLWTHQHPQLKLLLFLKKTQVLTFKKGVSNSATQDSIMNAHNKTQFTYAKIKCALKNSSCDSLISTNLMLTILASNASSSSTIVFKYPHPKNDSIFTQWFHSLKLWNRIQRSHS
ncbi:hypothetical protein H5410_004292, partial [Solanum commersonii]